MLIFLIYSVTFRMLVHVACMSDMHQHVAPLSCGKQFDLFRTAWERFKEKKKSD